MKLADEQAAAVEKFRAKKFDRVTVNVPKGKRDAYKLGAEILELSLSQLVQTAVEEYLENHWGEVPATPAKVEKRVVEEKLTLSAAERRLLENFAKLPKSVQKKFAGLIKDFAARHDS